MISTVPQTSRLRFIYFLKCWTEQFSQQFACIVVSNWFDAFNFRLSVHWLIECLVASLLRGKLPIRHQSDVMTALPHHSTRTSQRMTLSPLSAIIRSESESKNSFSGSTIYWIQHEGRKIVLGEYESKCDSMKPLRSKDCSWWIRKWKWFNETVVRGAKAVLGE